MVAAAVAGSAVAGLAGSAMSSSAAGSAAGKQSAAANVAAANSVNQQNYTNAVLDQFVEPGQDAAGALDTILGLPRGNGINPLAANGINSLTFQPTQAQLEATPGYQFDLAQGQQAVANSNAAQGRGISGAALKGAANYATGLANNTLTTQAGIFNQNVQNVLNPLQNLASLGENAGAQSGSIGAQNTQNANNALIGGANASAAGTVGSANALSGGLGSLGGAGTNYLLYNQLLGNGGGGGETGNFGGSGALGDSAF